MFIRRHSLAIRTSFVCAIIIWAVALATLASRPVQAQDILDQSDEIVYIDSNGFIRVLDLDQTADNPAVQWRSPGGDWYDAALGDFNGDGDAEIVAIGDGQVQNGVATVRLTVFDPVVTTGPLAHPEQRINGIPWEILYSTVISGDVTIEGYPLDVAVGRFLPDQQQDGIVVGAYLTDPQEGGDLLESRISLLDATSADGRGWMPRFERDFSREWTLIRTGNADNMGIDEVVLVDEGLSALAVYRVENGMSDTEDRIFVNGSESKRWNDAVVAPTVGGTDQLVSVRGAPEPLASLLVTQYDQAASNTWNDLYTEWLNPAPLRIIPADVNNSGDDELYLLRDVPSANTWQPRFFMRNLGDDSPSAFEVTLDADNGYREGAGGDLLGDDGGREELVIIRDNNIRVFTEPEVNPNYVEHGRSTNVRTVHAGDLDANGFFGSSVLVAVPSALEVVADQGETSGPHSIDIYDAASNISVPFSYSVQGDSTWVTVEVSGLQTPARFQVNFDAQQLLPGEYRAAIEVTASYEDIVEENLTIAMTLTIEPGIAISPAGALFEYYPCEEPLEIRTQSFALAGPNGMPFSARTAPDAAASTIVPWATVEPTSGTLPSTVTLTVDPHERTTDSEQAVLVVSGSQSSGLEQTAPVFLNCVRQRVYLPMVAD